MHPQTATKLGLQHLAVAEFSLAGRSYTVTIHWDELLPEGVATLPRSVGIPFFAPAVVNLAPSVDSAVRS